MLQAKPTLTTDGRGSKTYSKLANLDFIHALNFVLLRRSQVQTGDTVNDK